MSQTVLFPIATCAVDFWSDNPDDGYGIYATTEDGQRFLYDWQYEKDELALANAIARDIKRHNRIDLIGWMEVTL